MEARMTGQFIERLEDGALRRRDLEWPTPGAHRRPTAGLRSRDGIELMLCVLAARETAADESARANDKLPLDRQAREPGGQRAATTDLGLAAPRQVAGKTMPRSRNRSAEVHDTGRGQGRARRGYAA